MSIPESGREPSPREVTPSTPTTPTTGAEGRVKALAKQFSEGLKETAGKPAVESKAVESRFKEMADQHRFKQAERAKYEAVGSKHGGTRPLELLGETYVVPADPARVLKAYHETRGRIRSEIRVEEPSEHIKAAKTWRNSSETVTDLIKDATSVKGEFAAFVRGSAEANHGVACFGPDDKFILKSESSLRRKVTDTMKVLGKTEGATVERMADVVRGSIVVDSPKDITNIVRSLQGACAEKGWDITFKSAWHEERPSGYVGVHAMVKVVNEEGKTVLAELQIHLPQIYDGTALCVKEHSHHMYEYGREAYGPGGKEKGFPQPPPFANQISVLQFLSHLEDIKL